MRAKDLILITTRLADTDFEGVRGLRLRERLSQSLALAKKFELNVILVLGVNGDRILLENSDFEDCDLAFDPTFEGSIFSSVNAGVEAATGGAFVLEIDTLLERASILADEGWKALDQALVAIGPQTDIDVLQLIPSNDDCLAPQLVTISGLKRLRKLPIQTLWPNSNSGPSPIHTQAVEWSKNHSVVES